MSSHTDEEVRAGYVKYHSRVVGIDDEADRFIAELNKLAIHPDVPVLLKYENGDIHVCCASEARTASDTVSVDTLIPAETVMNLIDDALAAGEDVRIFVTAGLADYTKNGPANRIDGGTDG